MVINPIADNSIIKPDLQEAGTRASTDRASREVFGKIFSSALESAKSEEKLVNKVKASEVAEIIKLEMLRNSLSMGEMNTEPLPGDAARRISMVLNGLEEFGNNGPEPDVTIDEQACRDSNSMEQDHSGLDGIISRASRRYHVEAGLIKAVIKAESNFNPQAVSHAGAEGLMQLMPATARGLGVTNSFDPEQNVMAGTKFLKQMLDRYDGNLNSALAAYNWGPGNLEKKGGTLPRETREYLIKVKGYYDQFSV